MYIPREKTEQRANICFDCEKACGRCSWSEYDASINGTRFQLPKGAVVTPVYDKRGNFYTYHITECPLFEETPPRQTGSSCTLDDKSNDLFLDNPVKYIDKYGKLS